MTRPTAADTFRLLHHLPVLPAHVHAAALAEADRTGNIDLTQTTVRREDAPSDLLIGYAKRPEHAAAYRHRTNRPREREHRAQVLAATLEGPNPPPQVISDALEAFSTKPTKTLADALCKVARPEWMDPDSVWELLQLVDDRRSFPRAEFVARIGPERALRLAQSTTNFTTLVALAQIDLPREDLLEAFIRIAKTTPVRGKAHVVARHIATAMRAILTAGPQASPQVHDRLVGKPTWLGQVPARRGVYEEALRMAAGARNLAPALIPWDTSPARPPSGDLRSASMANLAAYATSADPQRLSEVVDELLARDQMWSDPDVVTTLLLNPALTVRDRNRITGTLRPFHTVLRGQSDLYPDLFVLFPDDRVAATRWAHAFPTTALTKHGWAPFGGKASAPDVIAYWRDAHPEHLESIVAAIPAAELTKGQLRELTPAAAHVRGKAHGEQEARSRLYLELLNDHLGDNPQKWATYALLIGQFPGTVGELLDTCAAVGA